MKENVLDVLMYIFENYLDSDSPPEESDQDILKEQLMRAGFRDHEVNKAFDWLDGLSALQDPSPGNGEQAIRSTRIYAEAEMVRLNQECRGLLMYLEELSALTPSSREMVIDRVMALDTQSAIDIDQLKWIILMVLFNQPGYEAAYAWMEDLVFNESPGYYH